MYRSNRKGAAFVPVKQEKCRIRTDRICIVRGIGDEVLSANEKSTGKKQKSESKTYIIRQIDQV
jgi:hypothetical protein